MRLAIALIAIAAYPAAAQFLSTHGRPLGEGPQQQISGKGAISGNVVNKVTHEPMKNVQVSVRGPVNLIAVTNDAGQFAFKLMPPGDYVLQIQNQSLTPQRPRFSALLPVSVTLAANELRSGVLLSQMPDASISGRLADDEGLPLRKCDVSAIQLDLGQEPSKTIGSLISAYTNEKGEYRIANLAAGNYLIFAKCGQAIPLPHAFLRRNSGVETPMTSYAPQFYPGTPDLHAATKLAAVGGSELSGIDFRLSLNGGITLRGKVGFANPDGAYSIIQLTLESRDPMQRSLGMKAVRLNMQSGEFWVDHVTPGSYNVVANTFGETNRSYAVVPIEIGTTQPEPLVVMLTPAMTLRGAITQEGDTQVLLASNLLKLTPLNRFYPGTRPSSPIQKDGTFSFSGVLPGRWLLEFSGAPGFIKSISFNNRQSNSQIIEITEGALGPINIVVSTATAQIECTVTGIPSEVRSVFGILWPVQEGLSSSQRSFAVDPQGKFAPLGLPPGKYVACAVGFDPWLLIENSTVMNALKSRCETLDLAAASHTSVEIKFIPTKDLEIILAGLDN